MAVVDYIYNNLFWIGMILLLPVFSRLQKIIFFEIAHFIKPNHKIIIRHIDKSNNIKSEFEVNLHSKEPLVRQIKKMKQGKK